MVAEHALGPGFRALMTGLLPPGRTAVPLARSEDGRIGVRRHEPLLELDVPVDLAVLPREIQPFAELLAALLKQAMHA